jgi:hypothetical protein
MIAIILGLLVSPILVAGYELASPRNYFVCAAGALCHIRLPALIFLGTAASIIGFILFSIATMDVGWRITPRRLPDLLKTEARNRLISLPLLVGLLAIWIELASSGHKTKYLKYLSAKSYRWQTWSDAAVGAYLILGTLSTVLMVLFLAFMTWTYWRHAHRLKQQLAKLAARRLSPAQVPLEARSLPELRDWLGRSNRMVLPETCHARDLAKTLLMGKTQPESLPKSPLASHMLAKHPNAKIGEVLTLIEGSMESQAQQDR